MLDVWRKLEEVEWLEGGRFSPPRPDNDAIRVAHECEQNWDVATRGTFSAFPLEL